MKVKSRHIITLLALTLSAGTGYACKCAGHSLAGDIAGSDMVFVGKVVEKGVSGMHSYLRPYYTFEIKKVYKGKLVPTEKYTIYQDGSSCTRRSFLPDETYLIFSKDTAVSQCNLSDRIENNRNIVLLDSIYTGIAMAAKGADEEFKLLTNLFNNNVLLSDYSNGNGRTTKLTIADKKVVFFDGRNVWMGKKNIKESDAAFYPTQYYLAADSKNSKWLQETGADYLIYVTNVHQALTLKPGYMNEQKPKPKVYKKIKAVTSI